jgi:type IV pilus assembly protein PilW
MVGDRTQHLVPSRCRRAGRFHQQGLTLVELMIASVLSLIIISALTTLFVDVSKANLEMAKTNSQIENARFAMQFLENDIVHAGYWGAYVPEFEDLSLVDVPADYPTAVPDPCDDFANWDDSGDGVLNGDDDEVNARLGISVQVYESDTVGTCSIISNRLANTDVLVIRHADTCVAGETNCEAYDANKLYFTLSNCDTEIDAGNEYALDPNSSLALTQMDCATAADNRKFIQNIYYVRDYAVTTGDGIPTLVRSEFDLAGGTLAQQPAQALVEGIERFRVELGLDLKSDTNEDVDPDAAIVWANPDEWYSPTNRGDGIPEGNFVHCGSGGCTVDQLANVAAVRLYILARANEPTPGYVDSKIYSLGSTTVSASALAAGTGYKRHLFATTVRVNNVAGRRETPP